VQAQLGIDLDVKVQAFRLCGPLDDGDRAEDQMVEL
jgi:hypothetical protein